MPVLSEPAARLVPLPDPAPRQPHDRQLRACKVFAHSHPVWNALFLPYDYLQVIRAPVDSTVTGPHLLPDIMEPSHALLRDTPGCNGSAWSQSASSGGDQRCTACGQTAMQTLTMLRCSALFPPSPRHAALPVFLQCACHNQN